MKRILLIPLSFLFLSVSNPPLKIYEQFDTFEKEVLNVKNEDTLYVINFWATWCGPCVKELPYFESLKDTFQGKNIEVLLVSIDMKKRVKSNLEPFLKKRNLKKKVVALTDGKVNDWIDKVDSTWTGSIPATVFLLNGKRAFYEKSYHSVKEIETDIKNHINK